GFESRQMGNGSKRGKQMIPPSGAGRRAGVWSDLPDPVHQLVNAHAVSAGRKILIVPVENSPPLTRAKAGTDSELRRCRDVLRGRDVQEIEELKRQGSSHLWANRLRPENDSQVPEAAGNHAGLRTLSVAEYWLPRRRLP